MQTYNNSVVLKFDTNSTGNSDSGAPVTVRVASTGALATIYNNQGVQILNPLTTDNQGNYSFKANDGIYNIIIREGQANELILYGIKLEDKPVKITKKLGELSARMQLGETVKIACYGDSTTDGNQTTGWIRNVTVPAFGGEAVGNNDHNDDAPNAWPIKLRGILREFFDNNNIQVYNAGYSGQRMNDGWALRNYDPAVTNNPFIGTPDLTFIGFGLNDIQGYVLQDHIDQTRLLIEKIIAYGTVPVLLTCGASFRNENNPRDHIEATREINQAKKTIAAEYGIPLIEFGEETQDWIQNNTDRYNWSDEQTDGLHFQDNGHAFQAQFMATQFLTDLVTFDGGIQEINSWSSKADYVGDYASRYRLSNNSQGGNILIGSGAPVQTDVMTMYVYSTNPNAYLIYQGIDNEWSESTIAPQVNIKEYFDLTTNSKDLISTGLQTFTPSRFSDVQYIHSKLKYGLNKITYRSGNSNRLFYGSFKISESMPSLPSNALTFTGPIARQYQSNSGVTVEAIGEQPLLVNTAGGFQGEAISISFDVECDRQGGILLLTGQGFSGSSGSVTNNQQNAILLFRSNLRAIALYDLAYNDGIPLFRLIATTAADFWPENRLTGRFELLRSGNSQVARVYNELAGGETVIDFTFTNDERVRWGGYVGGVYYNADTNNLPGTIKINSLVINRDPSLLSVLTTIPKTGIYTGGDGITIENNVVSNDFATSLSLGGVLLADDTVQTVAPVLVSETVDRSYAVQLDANGVAVVNVPWVGGSGALTAGQSITIDADVINLAIAGGSVVNDLRYLTFHNDGTETLESAPPFAVNPSTGVLSATTFSGSGASLTSLPAGQLTGTISNARLPSTITSSTTGNAATVTNGVYTTGSQTIGGLKTFSDNVTVGSANSEARLLLRTSCTFFSRNDKTGFFIGGATRLEYVTGQWNMFGNLTVSGTATANGVLLTSAAKYKDIDFREGTAESLRKVCAIGDKGVAVGTWKEGNDDTVHRWFIADEVNEIMPEVVVKKDGEVEALNYNEMLADAYAAISELNKRIKSLEP